ncbi:MAG: DegV family protein [Mycoplasma sp.]
MEKIKIIIDTMTTLQEDYIKKNDLLVLKNCLSDSKGNIYPDERTDEQKRIICEKVKKEGEVFTTSFINGAIMQDAAEKLLKTCDKVLYISLGKGFSGQFNVASQVEKEMNGKFIVFDTDTVAANTEILVRWLVEYIKTNPVDKAVMEAKMRDINETAPTLFTTRFYDGLIKAGRMPSFMGKILKVSKLFPIVATEESNKKFGFFKKWETNQEKLIESMDERFGETKPRGKDIKTIYITSSLLPAETIEELKEKISKHFQVDKKIIEVRTTPLMVFCSSLDDSYGITILTNGMKRIKL